MSHFYDRNSGFLYDVVPNKSKPGEYRDFTLRDARPLNALPSVTTVLSLLSKPGLVRWQIEQGIKAAAKVDNWDWHIKETGELDPAVLEAVRQDSEAYTRYTQNFGTAVHWWLNYKLQAVEVQELPPIIPGAEEVADGVLAWLPENGYDLSLTEHRFVRVDLGYAGTVDLVGTRHGKPCIVDLKTQEPPLTPYLEHSLQLAGYDYALETCSCEHMRAVHRGGKSGDTFSGCAFCSCTSYGNWTTLARERISLIANRANPGEVKEHIWLDKGSTIERTNARYDKIWLGLVELWIGINQYDPREVTL